MTYIKQMCTNMIEGILMFLITIIAAAVEKCFIDNAVKISQFFFRGKSFITHFVQIWFKKIKYV